MAKVSLKNVSKIYPGEKGGEINAVKDLSLEIADREFVVLVGPSGCGKSTTLRMIAGLEEISKGDIYIGEKRVNGVAPKDRDIAMVFQNYALYPHMSVYDNLAFGLKLRKFSKPEIKKRVVDAASILGIESLLDRKPKALSGAQRQRVAVGRAIVRQPKVFLFDEPLSNLDAKMRVQMRTEIIKLHQRLQATMIYVTQRPDRSDDDGRPDRGHERRPRSANRRAARPLQRAGQSVRGGFSRQSADEFHLRHTERRWRQDPISRRRRRNNRGRLRRGGPTGGARSLSGKISSLGFARKTWTLPRLSRKEGKAAGTGFPAIVDIVEPMGAETNLYLQTGAHTLVCRSQSAFDRREAGRRLQFEMNLAKAHLFDPVSTVRLR